MSLYRCAACGSPNVVKDSQAGGVSFNYKKGIVGTVVLGAGGAAAGAAGIQGCLHHPAEGHAGRRPRHASGRGRYPQTRAGGGSAPAGELQPPCGR